MKVVRAIEWAGVTDRGVVREHNEDAFSIAWLGMEGTAAELAADGTTSGADGVGLVAVVADGVGGQNAGEVASGIVTDLLAKELARTAGEAAALSSRECGELLDAAVRSVNARIRQDSAGDPKLSGMASTLSCVWLLGRRVFIAQVGDSRIYRVRHQEFEQISHDQSRIGKLRQVGTLSEEEARFSPMRNVVDQALGMRDEELSPEVDWLEVMDGDAFLVCSDGLTDRLDEASVTNLVIQGLQPSGSLARCAAALVAAANEAGGRDNITVVLLRSTGPSPSPSTPPGRGLAQGSSARPAWIPVVATAMVAGIAGLLLGSFGAARHRVADSIPEEATPVPVVTTPAVERTGAEGAVASLRTTLDRLGQGVEGESIPVSRQEWDQLVRDIEQLEAALLPPADPGATVTPPIPPAPGAGVGIEP